jgi:hypothetical protein
LIDITKLPPPQFGPIGLSGWQDYLARPDVLAILQTEYLSQLSRAQLAARKFAGGIDMSTGREWPDWTTSEWVDFHTYKELQKAANLTAWAREQEKTRVARPAPSPAPEVPVEPAQEDLTYTVPGVQSALREDQPRTTDKYALLLWAIRNFLPAINKKGPTIWAVYCYLVALAPDDFRAFKVPSRELAEGAGVSTGSVPGAVDHLHALGLVEVKKGLWNKDRKKNVLAVYRVTPLEEIQKIYGATTPSLKEKQ